MKKSYLTYASLALLLSASVSFAADDNGHKGLFGEINNGNFKLKKVNDEDKKYSDAPKVGEQKKVVGGAWASASVDDMINKVRGEKTFGTTKKVELKDSFAPEESHMDILKKALAKKRQHIEPSKSIEDVVLNVQPKVLIEPKVEEKPKDTGWTANDNAMDELGDDVPSSVKSDQKVEIKLSDKPLDDLPLPKTLPGKMVKPTGDNGPKIVPNNSGRKLPPLPTDVASILTDKTGFPLQSTVSVKERLKQLGGTIPLFMPQPTIEKKTVEKKTVDIKPVVVKDTVTPKVMPEPKIEILPLEPKFTTLTEIKPLIQPNPVDLKDIFKTIETPKLKIEPLLGEFKHQIQPNPIVINPTPLELHKHPEVKVDYDPIILAPRGVQPLIIDQDPLLAPQINGPLNAPISTTATGITYVKSGKNMIEYNNNIKTGRIFVPATGGIWYSKLNSKVEKKYMSKDLPWKK